MQADPRYMGTTPQPMWFNSNRNGVNYNTLNRSTMVQGSNTGRGMNTTQQSFQAPIRRCYNCGDVSHFRNNCPQLFSRPTLQQSQLPSLVQPNLSNSVLSRSSGCYHCGNASHFRNRCPLLNAIPQQAPLSSTFDANNISNSNMMCSKCGQADHLAQSCPLNITIGSENFNRAS